MSSVGAVQNVLMFGGDDEVEDADTLFFFACRITLYAIAQN